MQSVVLLALVAGSFCSAVPRGADHLSGKDLVDYINTHQNLFVAVEHGLTAEEMAMKAMKSEYLNPGSTPIVPMVDIQENTIPTSFDARTQWKSCSSLNHIRNQGQCGSCWAFGAAEVITDRICIRSNQQQNPVISSEDILDCCNSYDKTCGTCDGGYPYTALNYYGKMGAVTGGDYGSNSGCKPYSVNPQSSGPIKTPSCLQQCRTGYSTTYSNDRHVGGNSAYRLQPKSVPAIQQEIMTNGPVVNCFDLYSDFYNYRSGVYVHTAGNYVGGHCVKIMGWGVDNGTPYWLAANSWGNWGEAGTFRILRGTNEIGFEEYVYGIMPK